MADEAEFSGNQGMPNGQPYAGSGGGEPNTDQYFQPGMHVNKTYEIIGLIGHGVYGSVYRVRHLFLGKEMALKVLRTDRVSETSWLRFQAEAAALSRLNHPNIVRIFDLGLLERTLPFYAMELLNGQSLEVILQRKKILTLDEILPVFRQVSAGLAYVHEHQIVHREIKPANIVVGELDSSGQPLAKIIDFGVAKLTGQADSQNTGRSGENVNPLYMSPEQCTGGTADQRSDIYSLGVVMFETLTGSNPFKGQSPLITSQRHQTMPVPTMCEASDGVDFPQQLERLVAAMLAKDPKDRPQSAAEITAVLQELEKPLVEQQEALKEGQITTRVRKPYKTRKADEDEDGGSGGVGALKKLPKPALMALSGLAAVVVLAGLGGGGYYLYTTYGPKPSKAEMQAQALKKLDEERLRMDALYKTELNKGSFFQGVVTQNGQQYSSFFFPEKFSLGDIELMNESNKQFKAQGKVLIPAGPALHFYPNSYCLAHSQILKRFDENDLQAITMISDKAAVNPGAVAGEKSSETAEPAEGSDSRLAAATVGDEVLKNIGHLKALVSLDIGGTTATDASFEVLNRFPKLLHLNLCQTAITGEALAQAPFLKQLETLELGGNSDVDKVLQELHYTTVIRKLAMEQCNLKAEDIIAISTMKKLVSLRITMNTLKDAELEPLKELPNLTDLALVRCGLSPACAPYIAAITSLKDFSMTTEGWSAEDADKFKVSVKESLPEVNVRILDHSAEANAAGALITDEPDK